jgi:S1-C subfamily serine protease
MGRRATALLMFLVIGVVAGGCSDTKAKPAATAASSSTATASGDSLARIPDVVQALEPSVVTIFTSSGLGSGVVYDTSGTIVTDSHVVAGATTVEVAFADGRRMTGAVLAGDPIVDLAVVKVQGMTATPAKFQTKLPRVGSLTIALGSPLGLEQTVSAGIVSGLHRVVPGSPQSGAALVDLIQTDAAISPGNSGGALANADGEVIGINEAYIPPAAGAVAIGFATPSATVVDEVEQLLKNGRVQHAFLGVQPADLTPQVAKELGVPDTAGALVVDVVPGGPADRAGIKPGDVITSLADKPIANAEELLTTLRQLKPGQQVPVVVKRSGQERRLSVTLGDQPS